MAYGMARHTKVWPAVMTSHGADRGGQAGV